MTHKGSWIDASLSTKQTKYLMHQQAAKALPSLCICTDSPEPLLLASLCIARAIAACEDEDSGQNVDL